MDGLSLIELPVLQFYLSILSLCQLLSVVFGQNSISKGVQRQSSSPVGRYHILGQLDIARYSVDVGDKCRTLQYWISDARAERLIGILAVLWLHITAILCLLCALVGLLLPPDTLLAGFIKKIGSTEADKGQFQNGIPDEHTLG